MNYTKMKQNASKKSPEESPQINDILSAQTQLLSVVKEFMSISEQITETEDWLNGAPEIEDTDEGNILYINGDPRKSPINTKTLSRFRETIEAFIRVLENYQIIANDEEEKLVMLNPEDFFSQVQSLVDEANSFAEKIDQYLSQRENRKSSIGSWQLNRQATRDAKSTTEDLQITQRDFELAMKSIQQANDNYEKLSRRTTDKRSFSQIVEDTARKIDKKIGTPVRWGTRLVLAATAAYGFSTLYRAEEATKAQLASEIVRYDPDTFEAELKDSEIIKAEVEFDLKVAQTRKYEANTYFDTVRNRRDVLNQVWELWQEGEVHPSIRRVVSIESSFKPSAESGVGAQGLAQIMPDRRSPIGGDLKVTRYVMENYPEIFPTDVSDSDYQSALKRRDGNQMYRILLNWYKNPKTYKSQLDILSQRFSNFLGNAENWETNIRIGSEYLYGLNAQYVTFLRNLSEKYPNLEIDTSASAIHGLSEMSYNGGYTGVTRAIEKMAAKGIPITVATVSIHGPKYGLRNETAKYAQRAEAWALFYPQHPDQRFETIYADLSELDKPSPADIRYANLLKENIHATIIQDWETYGQPVWELFNTTSANVSFAINGAPLLSDQPEERETSTYTQEYTTPEGGSVYGAVNALGLINQIDPEIIAKTIDSSGKALQPGDKFAVIQDRKLILIRKGSDQTLELATLSYKDIDAIIKDVLAEN